MPRAQCVECLVRSRSAIANWIRQLSSTAETVCRGRGGTHRVSRNHRRLWCRGLGASSFYCVSGRAARRRIIGQGGVRYVGVPRVLLIHAQIQQ
jgi:hypothetical protein